MTLAEAHIEAERRLRVWLAAVVGQTWSGLGEYNRSDIPRWLEAVVPLVEAAQRQSVALTDAYLAAAMDRQPVGVDVEKLIGASVRNGVAPDEVYRRPFVQLWSALSDGVRYKDAVAAAGKRAESVAATDVQLSMTNTLRAVGDADSLILGYQRVPDGAACNFCKMVAGRRYHSATLMPIHNHCGCGVEPIFGVERPNFTGKYANDIPSEPEPEGVAVRDHGEMGPLLVAPEQHFQTV